MQRLRRSPACPRRRAVPDHDAIVDQEHARVVPDRRHRRERAPDGDFCRECRRRRPGCHWRAARGSRQAAGEDQLGGRLHRLRLMSANTLSPPAARSMSWRNPIRRSRRCRAAPALAAEDEQRREAGAGRRHASGCRRVRCSMPRQRPRPPARHDPSVRRARGSSWSRRQPGVAVDEDRDAGARELLLQVRLAAVDDNEIRLQRQDPLDVRIEQRADAAAASSPRADRRRSC